MRIIVRASKEQKEEWLQKSVSQNETVEFLDELTDTTPDVFFDLLFNENNPEFIKTDKPVFINAVITILDELPGNYIRINAWDGFLKRDIVELAANDTNKGTVDAVMTALHWKYKVVPDIPGMISIRIISMIINEAYYALGDKVSTKDEIDIAMKLGTNYPYGPFEWGKRIGLKKIYNLLEKMSESERRYTIAPLLKEELLIYPEL